MAKACILVTLLAVAYTATVSSALYTTTTNGIGTWTDLFPPSHDSSVGRMHGLSCNTDTSCYVYSESGLYSFPGVPNGTLTPLTMPDPRVITAIVVSGPVDAPGGVVVVEGNGKTVNYPVNNMTFMPSNTPPGFQVGSMDARTSTNGQEVLVMNSNSASVLYSSNGGKDFNLKTINVTLPGKLANKLATSRYGHMVDKNTWYVTMGLIASASQFYTLIVKTTDGGNTWTTQFLSSSLGLLFFNAIECLSATHCVAVGEGFGVYIFRTVNGGLTWKRVSITLRDHPYLYSATLSVIRANAHGHLFAAGSWEARGLEGFRNSYQTNDFSFMLTSIDGGATWVEEPRFPFVVAISGLSFTPGGVGFATATFATSIYDIHRYSTILRYDPAPSQLPH